MKQKAVCVKRLLCLSACLIVSGITGCGASEKGVSVKSAQSDKFASRDW